MTGEKSEGRLCNSAKYFAIEKKQVKKGGRTHQKRVGARNARCKAGRGVDQPAPHAPPP